ncbi:MAG: helix-turn-helix domain-containing protein [Clostridia bacterium]|nr:helix-turn-helix domain-containing protein [Clostridia bacterium]
MEKKTIGKFISVLRRANGFTQAELAEKLFVSDKTISRWECDESSPDLALIPVIADLFGVSVDELLRGERIPAPTKQENNDSIRNREQEEKCLQKLLKQQLEKRLKRHKTASLCTLGVAFLGVLIGAVIAIATPWKTTIGKINPAVVGGSVAVAAVLLATIAIVCLLFIARPSEPTENDDSAMLNGFYQKCARISAVIFVFLFSLLGFSFPLFFARSQGYGYVPALILIHSFELGFLAFPLIGATAYHCWRNKRFPVRFGVCALICAVLTVGLVGEVVYGVDRTVKEYQYEHDRISFQNFSGQNFSGIVDLMQQTDDYDDYLMSDTAPQYTWQISDHDQLEGVKGAWNIICDENDQELFRFFWSNRSVLLIEFDLSITDRRFIEIDVLDRHNPMTYIEENRYVEYTWLKTLLIAGSCSVVYLAWTAIYTGCKRKRSA